MSGPGATPARFRLWSARRWPPSDLAQRGLGLSPQPSPGAPQGLVEIDRAEQRGRGRGSDQSGAREDQVPGSERIEEGVPDRPRRAAVDLVVDRAFEQRASDMPDDGHGQPRHADRDPGSGDRAAAFGRDRD
jgi:hypothetical protein